MTKYPAIKAHYDAAVRDGWPKILVVNRSGADERRARLMRGTVPRGWKASVEYVPSAENQSHGSTLGIKLRRFCDGTKFRYSFY